MAKLSHLEYKFSIASYELLKQCEPLELKFYLYLKMYAIRKHEAFPSYSTICYDLQIRRDTLSKLIKELVNKKRLQITKNKGKNSVYDIVWYDNLAARTAFTTSTEKRTTTSTENGLALVRKSVPERSITITSRNKTSIDNTTDVVLSGKTENPESQVSRFISLFKPINPTYDILFKQLPQRQAIKRLRAVIGAEQLEKVIIALPAIVTRPYAPRITTPYQLERKYGELLIFLQQKILMSKVAFIS
mgnify:CR=1 FL=1